MSRQIIVAAFCLSLALLTGCGASLVAVTGEVTLDGKPVDGATVTFVSEDGKTSAAGSTDASGNFTLMSGEKTGIPAGNYKVLVVKNSKIAGAESMDPQGMKKQGEDDLKANKAKGDMGSKMKMGSGGMGVGGTPVKSELPSIYAAAATTTLTATVPASGPIKLELKTPAKK